MGQVSSSKVLASVMNTRFRACWLLLILACFGQKGNGQVPVGDLRFGQVDWFGSDGSALATNSLWGGLEYSYVPHLTNDFYLNVAASRGGGPSAWIVQNLPLFAESSPSLRRQLLDINLAEIGVASGSAAGTVDFVIRTDPSIRASIPTGPSIVLSAERFDRLKWSNVGSPDAVIGAFNPGEPIGVKIAIAPMFHSKRHEMTEVQEKPGQCFPGSTARSLDWLNRENNLGIKKSGQQIYRDIEDLNKNLPANVIQGATEQINRKNAYAKGLAPGGIITKVFDESNFVNPIPGVQEFNPTDLSLINFLKREFATEDVELSYYWRNVANEKDGAHIVTITDLFMSDSGTFVKYRDDERQDSDVLGAKIDHDWTELLLMGGQSRFGTEANRVWYVMSESVPEPGAYVPFCTSFLGLLTFGWRYRTKAG